MVARALAGALLVLLGLTACNTADDTSDANTTGETAQFEITGDVSAVDIEDVDFDPNISTGNDGIDIDPEASIRVQLTVNIESINAEAAELCKLQPDSDAIVVVTEDTDLDFDSDLSEMDTLDDESIIATGTAEERLVESDATPSTTDPDGACVLTAERVRLAEETPAPNGSPTEPGESPTPSPSVTATA
jgi:hypothetical protein